MCRGVADGRFAGERSTRLTSAARCCHSEPLPPRPPSPPDAQRLRRCGKRMSSRKKYEGASREATRVVCGDRGVAEFARPTIWNPPAGWLSRPAARGRRMGPGGRVSRDHCDVQGIWRISAGQQGGTHPVPSMARGCGPGRCSPTSPGCPGPSWRTSASFSRVPRGTSPPRKNGGGE